MIPHLKNLDVIVAPRAPRACRKYLQDNDDKNDDDTQNGAAPTIVSDIPKELEGKSTYDYVGMKKYLLEKNAL